MAYEFEILAGLVALALLFDLYNGMNDAANSIATVVSTGALSPLAAVLWAAAFNFAGLFVYGTAVAKTIGSGLVDVAALPVGIPLVTFAALVGAIAWAAFATHTGLPVSISHCLIGGLVGSGVAAGGASVLIWGSPIKGLMSTFLFIVLSPLIGLVLGLSILAAVAWALRRRSPGSMSRGFRLAQLFSSAFYSIGHGGNDAQKTAGIITFLFIGVGLHAKDDPIPFWILLASFTTIAIGTILGGWKVIRTLGQRVTALRPHQGFAAETGGAVTLAMTAVAGIPVSTTHTITGSIIGVGTAQRFSAVRWGVTRRIFGAWILTIPVSATVAGLVLLASLALGLR
ncbi:MAG TPA: inorganic phosphate transporter [Candidatus Thermoplasmatota archaeon]|nr:inorganic phosphate transporter [Candidatus Thermoplasmatota archaeon]